MMNLNYREFCEQLCECVQRILGDEIKVREAAVHYRAGSR